MKTAVLDSGFAGPTQQTIPLVLEPARKTHRAVTGGKARKPKCVVVPFFVPESGLEAADARMRVPKSVVWQRLEFGFVMVLLASAFVLISLSVAAGGNL